MRNYSWDINADVYYIVIRVLNVRCGSDSIRYSVSGVLKCIGILGETL